MLSHSTSNLVLCSLLSLVIILLKENDGSIVANKLPSINPLRRKQRNIEGINWDSHHQQQSYQHKQTKYPPIRNGDVNVYLVIPRLQKPVTECPPPEWRRTAVDITTPKHTIVTPKTPTTTASNASTPPASTIIAFIVFPLLPTVKTCREKFTRLGDKCYHFSDKQAKWLVAYKTCPDIGGEFAHPNKTENQRLKDHLRKLNRRENWWFGGNDRAKEGSYVWAHNWYDITFFDWDKRAMLDKESYEKDCMFMKNKDFKWNVEKCDYKFRYICEHGLAL